MTRDEIVAFRAGFVDAKPVQLDVGGIFERGEFQVVWSTQVRSIEEKSGRASIYKSSLIELGVNRLSAIAR
jgi:hypothetical protein